MDAILKRGAAAPLPRSRREIVWSAIAARWRLLSRRLAERPPVTTARAAARVVPLSAAVSTG